jgi:hypothetical protein
MRNCALEESATGKIRWSVGAVAIAIMLVGCGGHVPRQGETTMPSPTGCFIQVWDAPRFAGITDYINGPRAFNQLRDDLPGNRVWANRIRSIKTGANTRVFVYAAEDFSGSSVRLQADQQYPALPEAIDGHIASMRIDCLRSTE